MQWICKHFNDLTAGEIYDILRLRNEVFVVEQNCVFQDADNKDQLSYHLMAREKDMLAAYARLLPPLVSYEMASIGRVVTSPTKRRAGLGRELMQQSIALCYKLFGRSSIKIGAQLYLKPFYESHGFRQSGDVYDEDGIDHIEMTLE